MDTTIKKTPPPLPSPLGHRDPERTVPPPQVPGGALSTRALVREITREFILLARKQLELTLAEARADLKLEARAAVGLGLAVLGAIVSTALLLVTVVLALARVMPAWGAGLAVSGFALLATGVAGFMGWQRRVREPLAETRRSLQQDVQLVKESVA